jgi:GAF domain-containing protein
METHGAAHRYVADRRQRRSPGVTDRQQRVDALIPSTQEALDRITYLAGEALNVPAVCASLLEMDRRLLTSSYGPPPPTALLLSHAFREHVVASRRLLVVRDGWLEPLVARNPAVRDGTVRACLGIPLRRAGGRVVGTLLAMDWRPRLWTALHLDLLEKVSALIMSEMEFVAAVRRASRSDVSSRSVPAKLWG